jgi:hypothetical protein
MLKPKALFLIAIVSWMSTSEAFAHHCTVIGRQPIFDFDRSLKPIGYVSGCFVARYQEPWGNWQWGYVPGYYGYPVMTGWMWVGSIECWSPCHIWG